MRTIGNGRIRRKDEGVSYGSGNNVKQLCDWDLATDDDAPTVEASGYFNALAAVLQVGETILARLDLNGSPQLKTYLVTANTGSVVTISGETDDDAGAPRAVVPTSDGLTTGLITATDRSVSSTSADANNILTLPAIADVQLGHTIRIFNGATGCELRTPATSNTKINNVDADSAEMAIPASSMTVVTKILSDNWMAECYVAAGTRTIPTPD